MPRAIPRAQCRWPIPMNALSLEQIRELLDSGVLPTKTDDVISAGQISTPDGKAVPYQLHHGWDLAKARICDKHWGAFTVELFQFIKAQNYSQEDLHSVLQQIQVDDNHWDWLTKTLAYKTSEYDWFFLMAEGMPQGVCLIYHPKPSASAANEIFYIEYVATAPWNRKNPMKERFFVGVGSLLIKHAMTYAQDVLKLTPGFSLHAIPRATGFYESIGMIAYPDHDKEVLKYYEMAQVAAVAYLEKH